MGNLQWVIFGLLGAFFAAVVSVLTKRALEKTDFLVALCVQSAVMLITLAGLTTAFGRWKEVAVTPPWAIGLVAASGVAAGLSWFFGYQALQLSSVAKAVPLDRLSVPIAVILAMIFLRESPSVVNYAGIALILAGALLVIKA